MDLRLDDQLVPRNTRAGKLLAIPYALELNDSSTNIGRQITTRYLTDMIVDDSTNCRRRPPGSRW